MDTRVSGSAGPAMLEARHLSPLMAAKRDAPDAGSVNFCPFGCGDHELTEMGYCPHLIGFYTKSLGMHYEPRAIDARGNEAILGHKPEPMKKGYKLVQVTTSSRVYSPVKAEHLIPKADYRDQADATHAEIMAQSRDLIKRADELLNPMMEGDWSGPTVYDTRPSENKAAPASKPAK